MLCSDTFDFMLCIASGCVMAYNAAQNCHLLIQVECKWQFQTAVHAIMQPEAIFSTIYLSRLSASYGSCEVHMSKQQVARILSYQNCMRQQLGFNATPSAEDMQICLWNSLRPTVELLSELARPNITCLHPRFFSRAHATPCEAAHLQLNSSV